MLTGSVEEQVSAALELIDRAAGPAESVRIEPATPVVGDGGFGRIVAVGEPGQDQLTAGLRHRAARLARQVGGTCLTVVSAESPTAAGPISDVDLLLHGSTAPEDVAQALASWCAQTRPSVMMGTSTSWSREVFGRLAVRLDSGLIGDALDLDIEQGRLVAWKAAFGGASVAAITSSSEVQLVTVQPTGAPRISRLAGPSRQIRTVARGSRVHRSGLARNDDLAALIEAEFVVGVGTGVGPDEYELLDPLLDLFDAELGATRKVADNGWLPRARQLGITGRSISPNVFLSLGSSGKFNHMVGVRGAGLVLAVNTDPDAPAFEHADAGIVGDWRVVVPALVAARLDSNASRSA
jgi:electron transfer flavoprotein alpha subunit